MLHHLAMLAVYVSVFTCGVNSSFSSGLPFPKWVNATELYHPAGQKRATITVLVLWGPGCNLLPGSTFWH